jgi:hypothetical protein
MYSHRLQIKWDYKKVEESELEFLQGQEFSILHVVQIGRGVQPASYTMGTAGLFLGGKVANA